METRDARIVRASNGWVIIETSHEGNETLFVCLTIHDLNRKINEIFYKSGKTKKDVAETDDNEEVM